MALTNLPDFPRPANVQWQLQDFGNTQKGALGGQAQRVNRLGTRWAVTVEMPPMSADDARAWSAALMSANSNGARWTVSQPSVPTGSPGAVVVNGASQSGASLACDGANVGFTAKRGQFVNVTTGGDAFCYMLTDDVTADASGNITLSLYPDLRDEPADGDAVTIGAPKVEGLLSDVPSWAIAVDHIARGFVFTLEESK